MGGAQVLLLQKITDKQQEQVRERMHIKRRTHYLEEFSYHKFMPLLY